VGPAAAAPRQRRWRIGAAAASNTGAQGSMSRFALSLPKSIRHRVDVALTELLQPEGGARADFARPLGELALSPPDSVSWRVFKNPVALFIGGVAAVILELAEPRVRTGVWEHTSFRDRPVTRLRRTGLAAMVTVYGPSSQARSMIATVARLHERISGVTPAGRPYRASDPELLDWVRATASYGILEAYCAYVEAVSAEQRDRLYSAGACSARLYGATGSPASQAEFDALFDKMRDGLERSDIVLEFLQIIERAPALPAPLRPMQALLVAAAVQIVPAWLRARLGLGRRWDRPHWQHRLVVEVAQAADRLMLGSSPAVQSCRRLGLPDDYLYRPIPLCSPAPR
jgi:uncharacterized protein (DUF2236 family)